jgi:hypothetical protein
LLHAYAAIDTWHNEALAVPADLTPVLFWQANPCGHGYLSGGVSVLLSQRRIIVKSLDGQTEKCLNTLSCYLPDAVSHLATVLLSSSYYSR